MVETADPDPLFSCLYVPMCRLTSQMVAMDTMSYNTIITLECYKTFLHIWLIDTGKVGIGHFVHLEIKLCSPLCNFMANYGEGGLLGGWPKFTCCLMSDSLAKPLDYNL